MKKLTLLLGFLFVCCSLNAQNLSDPQEFVRCAYETWHQQEMATNPKYAENVAQTLKRRKQIVDQMTGKYPDNGTGSLSGADCATNGPVIIPTAVHYDFAVPAGDQACLIALAEQQIAIMNADFSGNNASGCSSGPGGDSDACITFVLANINHPAGTGLNNGDPAVTFNSYGCPPASPCNIATWNGYMNLVVQTGTGVLGIAPLNGNPNGANSPIVEACAFGGMNPPGFPGGCASAGPQSGCAPGWQYTGGATATHEVGHYLGLDHTFCVDDGNGQTGCADSDCDGFTDTPPQDGSYYGCQNIVGGCPSANGCGDTFNNFMDYLDDGCMNSFSDQQTETMFDNAFADPYVDPSTVFAACSGIVIDSQGSTCNGTTDYTFAITVTLDNASTYTVNIIQGAGTTVDATAALSNGTFTITYTGIALGTNFQVEIVDDNDATCDETSGVQNLTCAPCTDFTDGPYGNLDTALGAQPTCGVNCGTPTTVDAFEVFSSEAYSFSNLTAGDTYTIDICSGPNAGSWTPDITVVDANTPTVVIVSSGGNCSVNFNVPANGDYLIIITNAGDGNCPDDPQVLDNGNLQVTQTNCPAACPPCDAAAVWVDETNTVVADPTIICPAFENIPAGPDDICFAFAPTGTPEGSVFGITSDEGSFFDSSPTPAPSTSVADGIVSYICFSQAEIDGSGGTSNITFTTDAGNVVCTNGLTIDWSTVVGSNDIANNFCNCVLPDGVIARTDTTVCTATATIVPFSVSLGEIPAAGAAFLDAATPISLDPDGAATCTAGQGDLSFIPLTNNGTVGSNLVATGAGSIDQVCVTIPVAGTGFNDSYFISLIYFDGTNQWNEQLYSGEVFGGEDSPTFGGAGSASEQPIDICFVAGTPGYTVTSGTIAPLGGNAAFDGTFDGDDSTAGNWLGQDPDVAGNWFLMVQDANCLFGDGPGTLADVQVDFDNGAGGTATPCTFTEWLDTDGVTSLSTNENFVLDVSAFAAGTYTYTAVGDCGGSQCTDVFTITVADGPDPGDMNESFTFASPLEICPTDTDFDLSSSGASGLAAGQDIAYGYWVITDPLGNTTIPAIDVPGAPQLSYLTSDNNFEGYFTAAATVGTTATLPVEATGATYYIAPLVINTADGTFDICTEIGQGVFVTQYAAFNATIAYDDCTATLDLNLFGGQPEVDAGENYSLSVTNDADPGTELAPNTNPAFADNPIALTNFGPGTYTILIGDGTATTESVACVDTFTLTIAVDCLVPTGVDNLAFSGGAGIVSSVYDFGGGVDTLIQSADDFFLATATDITAVAVNGFFAGGATGNAIDYNVEIYSNVLGQPGAMLCNYTALPVADPTNDSPVIDLPTPCSLGPGTYWISVYVTHDQANGDPRWNWANSTTDSGNDAILIDVDDFFAAGATNWTNINTLTSSTDYFDLAFALFSAPTAGDADAIVGSNIVCCGETISITNSSADYDCTSTTLAYAIATTNNQAGVMAAIGAGNAYFANGTDGLDFTHACPGLAAGTYWVVPFLSDRFSATPQITGGCEDYGNGVQIQVVDDIDYDAVITCGVAGGTYNVVISNISGGTGTFAASDSEGSSFTEAPAGTFTATGITIADFATYSTTVANTTNGQNADGCPVTTTGFTAPSCGCPLDPTAEAGTAADICADGTVDLTTLGASIGGSATSGTWSGAGTFDNTAFGTGTSYTPTAAEITAGSATITLTTDDPDGAGGVCDAASDNVTVTINALPNEPAPAAVEVCASDLPVTLTAPGGYAAYVWSTVENTQAINVNAAGNYDVTITDGNGCTQTLTYNVTVNANPNEAAPAAVEVCADATPVALTAPAGYSYSWWDASTGQSVNVSTSGSYDVTITDANDCTQTLTYNVTVNANPNEAAPAAVNVCASDVPATLSAPAGYNYTWWDASNGQSVQVSTSGSYDVTITDGNGCTQTLTYNVTVNANPNEAAPAAVEVCADATPVTLSAPAGYSYMWWDASNGQSVQVSASGSYDVTITDGNNCSQTLTYNVTVNALPDAEAGNTDELTCVTTQIQLSGSSTDATAMFAWTTAGGNIVSGANTATPTIDAAGTYTLTVTNGNGCTATDDVVITTDTTAPTAEAGSAGEINCAVTSINLDGTGSSTGANITYSWAGPNVVLNGNTLNPTVGAPGTYTLTVTNTDNGCIATDDVEVTQSSDVPSAIINGAEDLTCLVSEVTLTADESGNAGLNVTYTWTYPDLTIYVGTSITTSDAGTYTLTVDNTDNGCSIEANVTINDNTAAPTADAGADAELTCAASTVTLDGTGSSFGANFTYLWTTADGVISSGANTTSPTVVQAGTYTITVTNTDNGCTATDDVVITTNAAIPTADAGTDQTVCEGDDVTLTGGEAGFSYSWAGPNGFTANTQSTIINAITTAGSGTYTLTVTNDSNGCSATDEVEITVGEQANAGADNSATFCEGDDSMFDLATLLNGADAGGNWSSGPIIDISSLSEGSYQYGYTVTGTGSCPNDDAVMTINIIGTANAGSDGGTSICISDAGAFDLSTLLSVDANAGGVWSPEGPNVDFTGAAEGDYNYTYTVEGAPGCPGDEASFTVSITATGNAGADNAATVCEGAATTFDLATLLSNDAAQGGAWSDGPVIDLTVLALGDYSYTYTVAGSGSCAADDANFTLSIVSAPSAGSNNSGIVCLGESSAFDLSTLLVGADAGGTWSPEGPVLDLTNVTPGNYSYTYSLGGGDTGCPLSEAVIMIDVQAHPNAGDDNSITVCPNATNSTIDLNTLLSSDALSGGTWSDGPVIDYFSFASGAYSYTYTFTNDCGTDDATITLNVSDVPTAGAGASTSICRNDLGALYVLSSLLDANTTGGGTWTDVEGVIVDGEGFPSENLLDGANTFTYTVGGENGCDLSMADYTVTVLAGPNAGADNSDSFCEGGLLSYSLEALLDANADAGGVWSDGPVIDLTGFGVGAYSYTYTASNGCGDDVATFTLNIVEGLSAGADNSITVCAVPLVEDFDLSTLLSADANTGGTWSAGPVIDLLASGTYTYTVGGGDTGCPEDVATFTVNVDPANFAGEDNTADLCAEDLGATINLADYLTFGAETGGTWSEGPMISTDGLANGTYTYTYTVDKGNECPPSVATITINIDDCIDPVVEISEPCDCDDPLNFEIGDTFYAHDVITITGPASDIWFSSVYNGLYDASGNALNGVISPTAIGSGVYELHVYFIPANGGYSIDFDNGEGDILSIGNDGADCTCITDGSITGNVFWDQDADSNNDAEPGISGAQVQLLDSNGNVIATTSSDVNGEFMFEGVEPGDYTIQISLAPGGFYLTTDPSYTVSVAEGENVIMAAGFGYAQDEVSCEGLFALVDVDCLPGNNNYNLAIALEGGDLGSQGYLISSANSALDGVVVSGSFIDGPFANGDGYSYTITSVAEPTCSYTVTQNTVQCIVTAIELLSFDGRAADNGNQLEWTTATEFENDYFILEKSTNGVNFEAIAEIEGAGNSSSPVGYSYLDTEIESGVAYYRLSAVDFNGLKEVASDIVQIVRHSETTITVQPVPASDYIDINLGAELTNWHLQVYDVSGKLVVNSLVADALSTYTLNIDHLTAGTYFLVVQDGETVMTTKFIKD